MNLNLKFSPYLILILSLLSCTGKASKEKYVLENNNPQVTNTIINNYTPDNQPDSLEIESSVSPEQMAKAREIIASISEEEIASVDANKKYKMLCTSCHGIKGNMKVNGAKDLSISKISLVERVAQIYHGKGLMTPYKGVLKEKEIVAISKYLEKLRK